MHGISRVPGWRGYPAFWMSDYLRPLLRNAVDVLPEGALVARLAEAQKEGRPLRVKLGLDPTAVSVTLGWSVVLSKLAAFQDAGHLPVLIVGDFTARVGDPSGTSKTRPMLTPEKIAANEADYLRQFAKILDVDRIEIRHNSEWLGELGADGMLELASRATLAQILERDDFSKRYAAGRPVSLQELMYPLLQGYDSVAIKADVELGGTDQKFNLLVGRDLQDQVGMPQQSIMTHELLVGTDGVQKMSQSLGNFVGLDDLPADMYGKTMSIPDEAMPAWYRLASGLPEDDVVARIAALAAGELEAVEAKRGLAFAITARFHSDELAGVYEGGDEWPAARELAISGWCQFDARLDRSANGSTRATRMQARTSRGLGRYVGPNDDDAVRIESDRCAGLHVVHEAYGDQTRDGFWPADSIPVPACPACGYAGRRRRTIACSTGSSRGRDDRHTHHRAIRAERSRASGGRHGRRTQCHGGSDCASGGRQVPRGHH